MPFEAAVAASLLVLAGCSSGKDQAPPQQAKEVGYVIVSPTAVPREVTLGGRTVAFETSEVRPQVSGVIRQRYFTEGSLVRAGQPLFQIDPSLYRAAVNQASANLASARASSDAASAKAARYKPLADMEAVARQDYTDAASSARVARATIAQNAAALDTARINLRFTTVPAPISGRIGRSLSTVGALASASQTDPLAVIQRLDPIYVDIQQSAADLIALRRKLANGGLSAGSTAVHLKLEDGSDYGATGTVRFSEVTVDTTTGTVTLRAQFPNPDGLLLPGMYVNAVFDQAIDPSAILVPQAAVQRDFDNASYVMVVGPDGKVLRKNVSADQSRGAYFVVTKGLAKGDKVIVQGLGNLREGMPVKAVPASTPQKVGAPAASSSAAPATGK